MVVFSLDVAPPSVRGELTRWFLEVKPGVFVGNVNARIRDLLWERVVAGSESRGAVMLYSTNTEQGFAIQVHGNPRRTVVDMEGVQLIYRTSDPSADELPPEPSQERYTVTDATDLPW